MANAAKTYLVEDADESAKSGIPPGVFPGTLAGLLDALDAATYRSAAARAPIALIIEEGKSRQIIRRFENDNETWSASQTDIHTTQADGPQDCSRAWPCAVGSPSGTAI